MAKPMQTNLDDVFLDEINLKELKCSTIDRNDSLKSNQSKSSKIIHFVDGDSIEIDENGNCIDKVEINENNRNNKLLPKSFKLFQLISSPAIDHFANIGKKTLKAVDSIGESIIGAIGITDSKYSSEINSTVQRPSIKN